MGVGVAINLLTELLFAFVFQPLRRPVVAAPGINDVRRVPFAFELSTAASGI